MFHFASPWFALLFPLPLLIRWLFPAPPKEAEDEAAEIRFPALQRLRNVYPSSPAVAPKSKSLFFILLSLSWAMLILALMQPENVDQFRQSKNKGYDLMLAVDISGSMQALDFSTPVKAINRLDVTKEVVGNFVKERQGDRLGLILFGQSAYLHVPLTLDAASVSRMLNDAFPGMAGNATAIGDAIGLGVRTLRERPEGSRVLVLLTDGEDNASSIPPLEAAKLAKQYGIRVYTVGIGSKGLVPFPNQLGGYSMGEVAMDEELLKEIAKETGGEYFSATNKKMLSEIYAKINELEKSEANETTFLIREPLYQYPLALSLLLLLSLTLSQLLHRREVYGS
ncbi:vWA domain-containing protein [Estrella lausannensis]|uniref:Protein BatA n=1 Tax=Estrella lausannensis TaxID=483423 RepID=A0A0H5DPL7_9BACT|nr:VWA domain-containing protein [Estrella lausannensis]CRX37948.1 protein BatA [Estrella lausannensis]